MSRKWSGASRIVLVIAVTVAVYLFALPPLFNAFLGYDLSSRFLISFAVIFPLGFLMGIPFPTILRQVKKESENDVAWMWGINVSFSVLGSVLAIVLAMTLGFNSVLSIGALTYLAIFPVSLLQVKNWRKQNEFHKQNSV